MDVAKDQHSVVALAWAHWAVSLFPTTFYGRSPVGVEMGGGKPRGRSWLVPVFCLSLLPAESVSKHSMEGSSPTLLSLWGFLHISIVIALGRMPVY